MRAIILGCGASPGVPRIDGSWGDCDPAEPKNRRSRSSILVEGNGTRVLVDTSPDLRNQFISNGITQIDAVLWSHDHADQTHGIDDIRFLAYAAHKRMPAYADQFTLDRLKRKFGYCFEKSADGYPPIIEAQVIDGPLNIGALGIIPIRQRHGNITSLGFRFGDLAYSNDVVALDEDAFAALAGVKIWIVDALRYAPHPSHSHVAQTLDWIARLKPERAILTNMNIELDYNKLKAELPPGIEPAYDGMVIEC
ncbi:MAG TPA: MBL fold metallo-hydrolase [Ferrovibrio sp.]|uniref:MBL fold metallo-hydrolase n=1 Tax=Ferrovibrio sp. TaxID=1917215 RepID=UPI002ED40F94